MKAKKRFLSLLLVICLVAGLMPTAVFAAGTDTGKAIQLVDSETAANIGGGQVSQVYFGTYQQSSAGNGGYNTDPIKWRVLENADGQLFLLSDQNLDVFQYHTDRESVTWEKSTMRSWLNGYGASENTGGDSSTDYTEDNFISTAFSEKEQAAIAETELVNDDNSTYGTEGGNDTTDKIFLLSIAEANNGSYFTDEASRISTNTAYVAGGGKISSSGMYGVGAADSWWLRSPGYSVSSAALVYDYGGVARDGDHVDYDSSAVRPAFNLDLHSVLFTSAAKGGKSASGMDSGLAAVGDYTGNEWKLTLLDNSRNFTVTEKTASGKPGDTITLNYSGATAGANEYISVIIADNSGAQYYGRVAQPSEANGQIQIQIPASLADGTYTLNVFSEQYNGGASDDTKLTDYASAFAAVTLTVSSDTAAPTLSNGTATRESETSATVKFTSDEAGSYYYAVVDSDKDAPDIDTTGTGIACAAGENTLSLTLDAGAKDLYIVVKDAAGNESERLTVEIPASALAAPQNPVLTGTAPGQAAAAWDAVANASGYAVQLYKDGAPQGKPMKVQGTDCTFAITEVGSYTFAVTALGTEGQYRDSEASGPRDPLPFYEISFAEGGIPAQYVHQGGQAAEPSAPAKEGYTFGGWYTDSALTTAWDFENDRVTWSMTLYAKWATVPAAGGSGTSEAPAATPAPQDDAAYYTCPACGYHDWTATADGYRCDHCGNIVTAQLSGYGNVKGAWAPAAAAASGAAYSGPIPATGDEADPALWAAVCGLSALALLALAAYRRKRL